MRGLLCHTADVQVAQIVNTDGRAREVWNTVGSISCRFTQPKTSLASVIPGANVERVDAVVYAEMIYTNFTSGVDAVRLVCLDSGWTGTYNANIPPRVYCDDCGPHHVEIDCVRVEL